MTKSSNLWVVIKINHYVCLFTDVLVWSLQYVRVVPAGGECYDTGPFFPSDPHHLTRMGIAQRRQLLLRPDWLMIGGLLGGAVVILCLCVTILVNDKGGFNKNLSVNKAWLEVTEHCVLTDPVQGVRLAWETGSSGQVPWSAAQVQHGRLFIEGLQGGGC